MKLEQKRELEAKLRELLEPKKQVQPHIRKGTGNVIRRRKGKQDKRISF